MGIGLLLKIVRSAPYHIHRKHEILYSVILFFVVDDRRSNCTQDSMNYYSLITRLMELLCRERRRGEL